MTVLSDEERFVVRLKDLLALCGGYELPADDEMWTGEDYAVFNIAAKIIRQEQFLANLLRNRAKTLERVAADVAYDGYLDSSMDRLDSRVLEYGATQIASYRRMLVTVISSFTLLQKDNNYAG